MGSSSNQEGLLLVEKSSSRIIYDSKREIKKEAILDKRIVEESSLEVEQLMIEENKKGEPFNYDDIMELHIGQLGRFQLRTLLLLCIPALFPGLIAMSYTFTGAVPNYRCLIEGCDIINNSTGQVDDFAPPWLNNTLPGWSGIESSVTENRLERECFRYNRTWTNVDECLAGDEGIDRKQLEKCDRWVYDASIFRSTVLTEFELTCDNDWKLPYPNIVFMAGYFFGAIPFGLIADRLGRKSAFTLCILLLAVVVTGSAFSLNFVMFCILRFITGFGNTGIFDIYYVWGIEAVGKKYRAVAGFIFLMCYTISFATLGLIAYFVRDWRTLQFIVGVPLFIFVGFNWIVPESIRWLISNKRYGEAKRLILKAGKENKQRIPEHLLIFPVEKNHENRENRLSDTSLDKINESALDVLRSPVLLKRFFILLLAWFASVMGYYGITYSANNLSGNIYVNYELVILIEIPAYISGMYATYKFGRRQTVGIGFIVSGLACLTTGLVPQDLFFIRVIFSLIGKFFASVAIAVIYSITVEVFPTEFRSRMMGLCSTSGRIGGILAPYLADTGRRIDPALPYIIFSIFNIASGLLCYLLPETNHAPLPENIQEAIELEKYTLSCLRRCRKKTDRPLPE